MKRFLCVIFLLPLLAAPLSASPALEKIKSWFEKFEEYMGRTDVITPGELQKLPVGLRTTIGNTNYDLLVTEALFGPENTEVAVYLRITGPDWQGHERKLYFGAENVLISQRGGFIGDVKLALAGDVTLKSKSDKFHITFLGRGDEGEHEKDPDGLPPTYAIVNCEGFVELQISGVLELTGDEVVFIEKDGTPTEESVRMGFFCNAKDLDDILVKVDVPEFTISRLPDWSFKAQNVMLDFSQTRNCPGFKGYALAGQSSVNEALFDELWQGLYIEDIELHFPDYIQKVDGARPSVAAKSFYLDERGCTGLFVAKDVLRLDEGSLGGWGFSVDEFSFDVRQNNLSGGGVKGKIEIPVSTADAYDYDAEFKDDGSWNTKIKLDKKASFDFVKGRNVTLYASSFLSMGRQAGKGFLIQANLSGKMQLNPLARENDNFGFGNVTFKNMRIQNQEPYFEVGSVEWDDELKFGNFPVSISDIDIHGREKDISLGFTTQVHLGDNSDANFGGALNMRIKSSVREQDGKHRWQYDGLDLGSIEVDVDNQFFTFAGKVNFLRDHKIYGNGFQGNLDFKIKPLGDMGLRADLIIGNTGTYKYWYFDMLARLGTTGIPIFPGFKIAGIGGGAYKHMAMETYGGNSYDPGEFGEDSDLGVTQSGIFYAPDSTKALGLKAAVVLAMQEEKVFNAELIFEMLFREGGGVSSIGFTGIGKMMTQELEGLAKFNEKVANIASKIQPTIDERQQAAAATGTASVTAKINLTMDFDNSCFTGLCDAYMDLGVIKGAGTNGHLGQIGMFFGKDSWYVKVGEPAAPLAVKLKVGPLQAHAGAYFMTGSMLPDFPGLPPKLSRLLNQPYETPDLNVLRNGAGLAFGSSLDISTGTIPLLFFYGSFDAEIGFDIMMKQYQNALCTETGTEPGINSWYANGQAYAYMMTDIGLYLKVFGKSRNFSVLKGEVGAMLRAGLPNPSSFSGALGVNVSILNGLVKGSFNLDFDLGESCTMANQGFADGVSVISGTLPEREEESVDVFTVPQASFNFPVETEIQEDYNNASRKLKITMDRYELWYGGTKLQGDFVYEQEKRVVKFVPRDVLPPNALLDFKLAVGAKEKKTSSWSSLKDDNGDNFKEDKIYSFKTGQGPDSIPWSNVLYCYPVRDQQYYLPKEYDKGFVYLDRGMSYLLSDADYRKRVVLTSGGESQEVAFTYDKSKKRIRWNMPASLKPSTQYELKLVLEYIGEENTVVGNTSSGGSSSGSTSQVDNTTLYTSESGRLEQETVTLTGKASKSDKNKTVLSYTFTTSRYSTFAEKVSGLNIGKTYRTPVISQGPTGDAYVTDPDVHYLQAEMKAGEAFSEEELRGSRYSAYAPLVQPKAELEGENYFQADIYPLVYELYPYGGIVTFEREPGQEVIPDWAVYNSVMYQSSNSKTFFPWIYSQPLQYKADFNCIIGSIANRSRLLASPYYMWLGKSFIPIKNGLYPVFLRYVLPDGTVTSQPKIIFNNK